MQVVRAVACLRLVGLWKLLWALGGGGKLTSLLCLWGP